MDRKAKVYALARVRQFSILIGGVPANEYFFQRKYSKIKLVETENVYQFLKINDDEIDEETNEKLLEKINNIQYNKINNFNYLFYILL